MPALQYSSPPLIPETPVPVTHTDFHGITFHTPRCETRPVAGNGPIRSDHDLIVRLCRMPVDLAAPMLRSSLPSLDTAALLALIAATGEAHHILIAQRPGLEWRVVRALMKSGHDSVLVALVRNTGIDLDAEDRTRLERLAAERPALVDALVERYGMPRGELDPMACDSHSNLKLLMLMRNQDIARFCKEAARRLHVKAPTLQNVLESPSAVPLALTFRALGLDRAVFLHLLTFWQAAHGGAPALNDAHRPLILSLFALPRDAAQQKLRAMLPV